MPRAGSGAQFRSRPTLFSLGWRRTITKCHRGKTKRAKARSTPREIRMLKAGPSPSSLRPAQSSFILEASPAWSAIPAPQTHQTLCLEPGRKPGRAFQRAPGRHLPAPGAAGPQRRITLLYPRVRCPKQGASAALRARTSPGPAGYPGVGNAHPKPTLGTTQAASIIPAPTKKH